MSHTSEPWARRGSQIRADNGNGKHLFTYMVKEEDAERACECVNELAGVENPVEALRVAREALAECRQYLSDLVTFKQINGDEASTRIELAEEAVSLIGMNK